MGQWGEFRVKNVKKMFKKIMFCYFHFFFLWSIKFPQQNINQSEIGIGDKKLLVELLAEYGSIANFLGDNLISKILMELSLVELLLK